MCSDFARDFVSVVLMSFFTVPRVPTTTGTVVVLSSYIRSTSISKSSYLLNFSVVVTEVSGLEGYNHVNEKAMSFLFFSTMSGLLAAMVQGSQRPGPGCSKPGYDNPRLVQNFNPDRKA